jgi:GntR family transcriptional regulator, transcriptional repressor for pyruvate dehydrogenase complex
LLTPVRKQSLSDAVFGQLRDRIVGGELAPGSKLPAERELCDALGVNRGSVREALRRLQQARLVSVRHGGTSKVLDYRLSAGLDLLADLIVTPSGELALGVVRSIVEVRSALAPDIARLAALRANGRVRKRLATALAALRAAQGDLPRQQEIVTELWSHLVDGSQNVVYRLAYNSLRASYAQCRALFTRVLTEEIEDVPAYEAIVAAVGCGDAGQAEARARALMRRGEEAIKAVLQKVRASPQARLRGRRSR